jgi:hypothetical protein
MGQVVHRRSGAETSVGWLQSVEHFLRHVQRNHALEHATINLLGRRYPAAQVMGFSGPTGFTLYSTLTADEIIPAVRNALEALKAGEVNLAVHEHCGTNLVITAVLTTLATVLGLGCTRRLRLVDLAERLPQAILLNVIAVLAAKPLGHWLQEHVTTNATLGNLSISSFFTDHRRGMLRVRVHTRHARSAGTPGQGARSVSL